MFLFNVTVDLPALSQRLYVDPSNYDDPHEALRELTNELDPGKLFLERLIGGGKNLSRCYIYCMLKTLRKQW